MVTWFDMKPTMYSGFKEHTGATIEVPGGKRTFDYYINWLNDNKGLLECYLDENYSEEDYYFMFNYCQDKLRDAYVLISDYFTDNYVKVEKVQEDLRRGKSKIIVVIGRRGAGKTATGIWAAEQVKNERPVYFVGAPQHVPDWAKHAFDIANTPQNSLVIMDESAIQLNARRPMRNANVAMSETLAVLRHSGRSVLFITQSSAMVDLNVLRMADILIFKPISLFGATSEREFIRSDLIKKMLPREKNKTLYVGSGNPILFEQPLPDCWDDKLSKPYALFKNEMAAIEFAKALVKAGNPLKYVAQMLSLRGFKQPDAYWNEKLSGVGKKPKTEPKPATQPAQIEHLGLEKP